MHAAASNNSVASAKILIEAKADILRKNNDVMSLYVGLVGYILEHFKGLVTQFIAHRRVAPHFGPL